MGTSTDGHICYGVLLEEYAEMPWDGDHYEGDLEAWWYEGIHSFKHAVEIYDETGQYIGGKKPSQEVYNNYFAEKDAFYAAHPCPVEKVNACHANEPIWILALSGTGFTANRGDPQRFDPAAFTVTPEQRKTLIDFCNTYGIATDGQEPSWWLSSYWG